MCARERASAICRGLFECDRHLRSLTSIQNDNAAYAATCLSNCETSYHCNTPFKERAGDLIHTTMPPAKKVVPPEDSRSDASTVRERQIAAAAHARKSKQNAAAAAAFKADFLAQAEARNLSRRQPAANTSATAAVPSGPKLGGSRAQRERMKAAEEAKANCPVSKALAGVPEITVDAQLA